MSFIEALGVISEEFKLSLHNMLTWHDKSQVFSDTLAVVSGVTVGIGAMALGMNYVDDAFATIIGTTLLGSTAFVIGKSVGVTIERNIPKIGRGLSLLTATAAGGGIAHYFQLANLRTIMVGAGGVLVGYALTRLGRSNNNSPEP